MMAPDDSRHVHRVNDIPYRAENGDYQMVVEIPAGTNEKWQTDTLTGQLYHDQINGVPRIINFLPYPMNYGMIPQTVLVREKGGDGDPIDVITLAPAQARGAVNQVRIIGALRLSERGEVDTKVVALLPGGPFQDIRELSELLMQYPGTVEIVRLWFEGYKGPGSFLFQGYASRSEAEKMIEEAHQDWFAAQNATV